MPDKAWKAGERAIAARVGGQRVLVTGRAMGDAADVAPPRLSIEVKHRRAVPAWLAGALAQATATATARQTAVAIVHRHGGRHDADLVVLRLHDFLALTAAGGGGGDG